MSDGAQVALRLLDEGNEVELDDELAALIGLDNLTLQGTSDFRETVTIAEDEADRAIRAFAAKVELAYAKEQVEALASGPYEKKLEFLLADEWVVVAPSAQGKPPKKCRRECQQICEPLCKEVCKVVCKKIPRVGVVCEPVCRIVCSRTCKQICQVICD